MIWSSNLLSRLAGNRTSVPMYFVVGFVFFIISSFSLDGGVLLVGGMPPFSGREKNKAGGRSDISLGLINLINQVQLLGVAILCWSRSRVVRHYPFTVVTWVRTPPRSLLSHYGEIIKKEM